MYLSSYLFKVCRRVSKFDSQEKCLWGNFLHLASPSLLHKGYDFEKRFSKTYANKDCIAGRRLETSLRILSVTGVLPTFLYAKKVTDSRRYNKTTQFPQKGLKMVSCQTKKRVFLLFANFLKLYHHLYFHYLPKRQLGLYIPDSFTFATIPMNDCFQPFLTNLVGPL